MYRFIINFKNIDIFLEIIRLYRKSDAKLFFP